MMRTAVTSAEGNFSAMNVGHESVRAARRDRESGAVQQASEALKGHSMKNRMLICLFGTCVLCIAVGGAEPKDEEKLKEQKASAKALVEALAKEDYKAAGKEFDDAMKKALPADKMETTWKTVLGQVGAFKKVTGIRIESAAKFDFVYVVCQFEKIDLDVKVVFNADKQITGLFFQPTKAKFDYKPPGYAKQDSFRESEATVGEGEWSLPGTLTLPKGDGPFPAVVLVQGSGPHDRDETIGPNKPFRDLAWGLASQGIAVLRYEKRTREYGAKVAALKDITPKEEVVDDALAAAAMLRKNKAIDGKRIFVLGHSLGASMAPRIAEGDGKLAGLILLAGTTRPLEDAMIEQITYILSLNGALTDQQKEELEKIKKQAARVKDPKLSPDTPASELPLSVPAPYWLALREYDPTATAAKLKRPMLILQGERDYQVTMADFEGWKKALGTQRGVRLKSYPKLNHLFMEGEGKAIPAEYDRAGYVAVDVVDDIAEWVKKQ
jgi:dienelactone hydrolase